MAKLEFKPLGQILNESGVKSVHWKGWEGDSDLILSQKYVAEVFAKTTLGELLKDIEIGNLQSLDKIAWRLREILGDPQFPTNESQKSIGVRKNEN